MENKIKKGTLTKFNKVWHVSYAAEPSGENVWTNMVPIRSLENQREDIADLLLVAYYNKPVCDLNGAKITFILEGDKAVLV